MTFIDSMPRGFSFLGDFLVRVFKDVLRVTIRTILIVVGFGRVDFGPFRFLVRLSPDPKIGFKWLSSKVQ